MSAVLKIADRRFALALGAIAVAIGGVSGTALAQRDPAYAQARAGGQIGEKTDGYLGVVGGGSPALRAMVESATPANDECSRICASESS